MKTFPPHNLSSIRNFRFFPQIFSFYCFISIFGVTSSFAQMYITGEQNPCPGSTHTYQVHGVPGGASIDAGFSSIPGLPYSNPVDYSSGFPAIFTSSDYKTVTITYNKNAYNLPARLRVEAVFGFVLSTAELIINASAPAPSAPNGGSILVCPNGPSVQLTTNTIPNDPSGCDFHCAYTWTAPSGLTLQSTFETGNSIMTGADGRPTLLTTGVSGSASGVIGQVEVKALWNGCNPGIIGDRSSYAYVYAGPPALNPTINGTPAQGYNCVTNGALLTVGNQPPTSSVSWSKIGGNGSISPNGISCYANPIGFMIVKVTASNACGTTTYTYYLNDCGSWNYKIFPNPAVSEITIDFEHKEFAEGMLESIELLDLDGKSYSKTNFKEEKNKTYFESKSSFTIDTKSLKRGNYVLHLDFGKFLDKKQIILK